VRGRDIPRELDHLDGICMAHGLNAKTGAINTSNGRLSEDTQGLVRYPISYDCIIRPFCFEAPSAAGVAKGSVNLQRSPGQDDCVP
jgi:hypothetical protein